MALPEKWRYLTAECCVKVYQTEINYLHICNLVKISLTSNTSAAYLEGISGKNKIYLI